MIQEVAVDQHLALCPIQQGIVIWVAELVQVLPVGPPLAKQVPLGGQVILVPLEVVVAVR
jgi:hypothetical protein